MRGLELGIDKSRPVDISSSINSYRARLPRKLNWSDLSYRISLRSMVVLSGARLSCETAKTRANERRSSRPNLLVVFLPSPAFITLRAEPKPTWYAGYYSIKLLITDKNLSLNHWITHAPSPIFFSRGGAAVHRLLYFWLFYFSKYRALIFFWKKILKLHEFCFNLFGNRAPCRPIRSVSPVIILVIKEYYRPNWTTLGPITITNNHVLTHFFSNTSPFLRHSLMLVE